MINHRHFHPSECLPNFKYEKNVSGRMEYIYLFEDAFSSKQAGDCAIIAVALATRSDYLNAYSSLNTFMRNAPILPNPNKKGELLQYIKQRLADMFQRNPKHRDPIYGVPSYVYGQYLEDPLLSGFSMVYGKGSGNIFPCICDPNAIFVVDGFLDTVIGGYPTKGAHVSAIVEGVVLGDIDITRGDFDVLHVWKLDPQRKSWRDELDRENERRLKELDELLELVRSRVTS